jgi:cysteine-rich repeat protein
MSPAEACDDANTEDGDGCSAACRLESCGNGVLDAGELCDDGNDEDDDDCTSLCRPPACGDALIQASLGEDCDDANLDNTDDCPTDCSLPVCADGVVEGAEECDPGEAAGDGESVCSAQCTLNACGDGYLHRPSEKCDDGNTDDGDECNATCSEVFVAQIDAEGPFTCARAAGRVRCWGRGTNGQLGYGNLENIGDDETPASVGDLDVGGTVIQLATGGAHACVLLEGGSVRCWGRGDNGQLGYGNTETIGDEETPASAGDVDVGGTAVQVTAGSVHTCALLDTGAVRCWGRADDGQLGYGNTFTIGDNETPSSAGDVDVGGAVSQIVAGGRRTCALLDTGAVRCWGTANGGRLGYANDEDIGDNETPASAGDVDVGGVVTQIGLGESHTCALLESGAARCWGFSLPYGTGETIGDDETPATAGDVDMGGPVIQLAVGGDHGCALLEGGTVRCWGELGGPALGYMTAEMIGDDETPADMGDVDVGALVEQITAGSGQTCAVTVAGTVRCWGFNAYGELGYGNTEDIGDDEVPATAGDVPLY